MKPIFLNRVRFTAALTLALCPFFHPQHANGHEGESHLGVDRNGNEMSDIFEALYPGAGNASADSDADGMNNGQEAAAGTSPFSAGEVLRILSVTSSGSSITASWPSVAGKIYQLQAAQSTAGPWVIEETAVSGTGAGLSVSSPRGKEKKFLRVQVSDVDTDADGVTDWEELKTGTDRYLFDTDGDGRSDRGYVESRLGAVSTVNVYPAATWASETGPRTAQFRITRHGGFLPLTIPYATGGTAVRGTDYTLSAASVQFAAGATEAFITVTPLTDAESEAAETVTLGLQPGTGWQVGSANAATITIAGQGLTGQYYNSSSSDYANVANFDPAQLALTRRDPAVDFNWSKPDGTPPGTGTGTPDPAIIDDDLWTAKWTGILYPKTSGVYQIYAIADRGVVVWVSTTPITTVAGSTTGARINQWIYSDAVTNAATKHTASMLPGSAAVVAGQPLYFRVDYRDSAGLLSNAHVQIRWSAPGVPEEVIPASAFSVEGFPGGPPVITSPPNTGGISGAPFSFQLTASNGATGWSVSGLPAGLAVDASGLISGTLNAPQGYYPLTVTALNAAGTDSELVVLYVTTTGGSATRELWNGVTGNGLTAVPFHTAPSSSSTVTTLESPDNGGDNFGERLRGYITAPSSGLYTFFLTSDENAELWVSASDEPARRLKRAWVSGAITDGVWDAQPAQKSLSMRLSAGQRYYFEALRRESSGSDHLAVAWLKPGQTDPALKEVIPSWALTVWSPPATVAGSGTLYAAALTPQAGANSLGSGSALLLVNEARTAASLSYTYSNLTGPVNSGAHIHDSRTISGQAGRIIYDVDDFDPDAAGNYPWVFTASTSHTVADLLTAIAGGTAYLNLHTTAYPSGEVKGFFYPVSGSQFFTPPAAAVAAELTIPTDATAAKREIVRFLQQATFGARHDTDGVAPWDADSIEAVQARGYAGWIDDQLSLTPGVNPETPAPQLVPQPDIEAVPTNSRPSPNAPVTVQYGSGPMSAWMTEYYQRYPLSSVDGSDTQDTDELWRAWWSTSVKAPDQLRHRMAFALSQILVLSEQGELEGDARAVGHYYDLLCYHSFGNFRTLLERITLNPGMGDYLDMLGNKKPNPATGYIPNENFAREILQLFSVGLMRLHPDGSAVLSSAGLPVTTYEQDNVVGFAHTFTGWNYPGSSSNMIAAMTPKATDHATGEKLLLENAVLPALTPATTDSCNAELTAALDLIFHHPNTGPFICRQLIQRLVTANPSPGYIYRVTSAFENDGTGTRGNLATVARAILLDPEARNQLPRAQTGFGHLKEPVVRATQILRAFNAFSYAERNFGSTTDLGLALCATQANIDITLPLLTTDFTISSVVTPYAVVDGFVLSPGSAVLVKSQTNPAENGLYTFTSVTSPLTRAANADSGTEVNQAWVHVIAGTNADKYFRQTAVVTTMDTDPQTWTEQTAGNIRRQLWGMGTTGSLNQSPLRSPTVFNFFEPGYVYLGYTGENGLYAPEFQITTETTVINTGTWFYDLTRHNSSNATTTAEPFSTGQGYDHGGTIKRDIKLDLTYERSIAADSGVLVDRIASLVMPGMLDPRLRTLVVNYLETLPELTDGDKMKRIGEAFYLLTLSPEFAWQK